MLFAISFANNCSSIRCGSHQRSSTLFRAKLNTRAAEGICISNWLLLSRHVSLQLLWSGSCLNTAPVPWLRTRCYYSGFPGRYLADLWRKWRSTVSPSPPYAESKLLLSKRDSSLPRAGNLINGCKHLRWRLYLHSSVQRELVVTVGMGRCTWSSWMKLSDRTKSRSRLTVEEVTLSCSSLTCHQWLRLCSVKNTTLHQFQGKGTI